MRLNGVDARLYPLVGPLVMNPAILRQNNNYPFKTSNRYLWYIAISDGVIVGFIPLKKNEKSYHIDNYYIQGDRTETIDALLHRVIDDLLTALVHKRHTEAFRQNHFRTDKQLTLYDKMEYIPVPEI
mgnify:FL=1